MRYPTLMWTTLLLLTPLGSSTPAVQECTIAVPEWAPRGSTTSARPKITATLTSTCNADIDVKSIQMTVDDEVVKPAVEGSGVTVTLVYTPAVRLTEAADHTVSLQAKDAGGGAAAKSWTFMVADTYSR